MPTILYIAIGGAAGAMLRYSISAYAYRNFHGPLPWGTLAVNLVGCFAIGVLWNVFENLAHSPNTRALIFIGILGAFTTFSTFGLELLTLIRAGSLGMAALYVSLSSLLGIFLVWLGMTIARLN